MLQLKVFKGPTQLGKVFDLEAGRTLVLGRANEADLRLKGAGVSKSHCRLTVLPGGKLEIEDLNSANGTFVNGVLVKKFVMRVGDTMAIHDFILQVVQSAPEASAPAPRQQTFAGGFSGNAALNLEYPADMGGAASPQFNQPGQPAYGASFAQAGSAQPDINNEPLTFNEKAYSWLDSNVFPWADKLSSQADVRTLMVLFFLLWSILMVGFTAMPFMEKANGRVRDQSIEVAKLYARQLVRLNQQAIIDRRYQDLIATLDSNAGATPGLMQAMILDSEKAQILAPEGLLRQPLPDIYAKKAIALDRDNAEIDDAGIAYVSAPIWVGSSDGTNKVAATVFVEFNTLRTQFTLSSIFDQAVTSLLYSLLASFLFVIFVYRWTEGSIVQVTERIDEAMKNGEPAINVPVRWAVISRLCEQVSSALGRAGGGGGRTPAFNASSVGDGEWARAATATSMGPAAAFDITLRVTAWNDKMARLIGIQVNNAVGADISDASRDIAFESTIRELTAESQNTPWSPQTRELEFGGVPSKVSVVFGDGAYFVSIGIEG